MPNVKTADDNARVNLLESYFVKHKNAHEIMDLLTLNDLDGLFDRYLPEPDETALDNLFGDLGRVDMDWVLGLRGDVLEKKIAVELRLEPISPIDTTKGTFDQATVAGQAALQRGEWATLVFAGGAATRFFSDAEDNLQVARFISLFGDKPPKGLFPFTPIAELTFLDFFVGQTLSAGIKAGRLAPMILMASIGTRDAIEKWAKSYNRWGFPLSALIVIVQAEHPRLDEEGNLIAQPDGHLVVTGDGHGGVYRALLTPGADGQSILDKLKSGGALGIVLHNVDNVAANALDPLRIGLHQTGGYAFSMTVVPRAGLDEKVGLVARNADTGAIEVVEYSVCPEHLATAMATDGKPTFRLAHINTNLASLDSIRSDLPPTLYTGKNVNVGGHKVPSCSHEMLNQHLSGLLEPERVGVILADRNDYFLPTKSIGGVDSLKSTVATMIRNTAERLRTAGGQVAQDAVIEFDPCLDEGPSALMERGIGPGWDIQNASQLFIGVRHGPDGLPPFGGGLVIKPRARLEISAQLPYGVIDYDPKTRVISENPETAGRVRIGQGVTLQSGAQLIIRLEGDGVAVIPDNTVIEGVLQLTVSAGTQKTIGQA